MRKLGWGIATLLLLSGVAAAAPAFRWTGNGSSGAVHYDDLSADGCVETTGDIVFTSAPSIGTQALTVGETIDYCNLNADGLPTESFFYGGGEIAYSQTGLSSATASGSFTATTYSGNYAELTFDFSVSLSGTGAVTTTTNRFISTVGGVTLSFNSQRQRSANASGSFTINGASATLSAGQLSTETAGELVILNK